jgi:hypothetical protein
MHVDEAWSNDQAGAVDDIDVVARGHVDVWA